MARKRYQRGSVYLDGQQWKGRYREDVVTEHGTKRVRREVILGGKHELPTKRLAERRMEIALARINALDYRPCRIASFGEFIERWKVEILSKHKQSSVCAATSHLRCYILPHLEKVSLEQFGVENQQLFITRISQDGASRKALSRKTVLNVLATLS